MSTASVLSFEHNENNQGLDFWSLKVSVVLLLVDLLESSRKLDAPRRLPSVMLLSWKKDPVDCVSRSEEEMLEELGEAVSKVLNETEPEKSRVLTNPILAFNG